MRENWPQPFAAGWRNHKGKGRLVRFQQVYYVLDTQHRILWVGGDWDEFALANAGAAARSNEVLATSVLNHIVDQPTADAVVRLVDAVRATRSALRIDYRCDSPTTLRRYRMTIQPMRDDRVLLVHDLRDARTFDAPLRPWKYRKDADHQKCSFCCAVHTAPDGWTPPEDLTEPHPESVSYTMCPACSDRVEEAVSSLLSDREPSKPVAGGLGP